MSPHEHFLRYLGTFGIRRPGSRVRAHASLALGPFHAFSLASDTSGPYRALAAAQGLVAPGLRPDDAWHALLGAGPAAEVAGRIAWLESTDPEGPHRPATGIVLVGPDAPPPFPPDPEQAERIVAPSLTVGPGGTRELTAWYARVGGGSLEQWRIEAPSLGPAAFDVQPMEGPLAGGDLVGRAHALLASSSPTERFWAATVLAAQPDPTAMPALLALLGDGDDRVREAAATALGRVGDARAVDPLAAACLGTGEPGERRHLIQVLAGFGDAALTSLSRLSRVETDADVRLEIVHALGGIATPAARSLLSRFSDDDDDEAVRGLARTYVAITR